VIRPNVKYRPNPSRAIQVDGLMDEQMLSRLTPQIIKLQYGNRSPITVYINSPGGQAEIMQSVLRTLRLTDQDTTGPCHIITVVTVNASSAAADLLSAGDYCIAYPNSTILYHGVRMASVLPVLQPFTAERTSLLAHFLRLTNDSYAMDLARKAEHRFLLRFVLMRPEFAGFRQAHPQKTLSDFDCFLGLLSDKLSSNAKKVLKKAQERYARYAPLLKKLTTKAEKQEGPELPATVEADRIRAIIDFELSANKSDVKWTFKDGGGLSRLVEDFYLIAEYIETQQSERLKHWCLNLGRMSLSKEDKEELETIPDEKTRNEKLIEKVQPPTQPVLTFFIALCHALQEEDNELTATDAYWFGLVDEVWGNATLFNGRLFEEFEEDKPQNAEKEADNTEAGKPAPAGT
jgi:ATP-dependent protease ClpP protease subunit